MNMQTLPPPVVEELTDVETLSKHEIAAVPGATHLYGGKYELNCTPIIAIISNCG